MDPFYPPFTSFNPACSTTHGDGGHSSFVSVIPNRDVITSVEPNHNSFQREMMRMPEPPQNGYEPLYHARGSGHPVQYSGAPNVWPRGMQQVSFGRPYASPNPGQFVTIPYYAAHERRLAEPDIKTTTASVRPQPVLAYNHCPTAGRNMSNLSSKTAVPGRFCNLQSQSFMCSSQPDEQNMSKPEALPWSSHVEGNGQTSAMRSCQELAHSPSASNWQPNELKVSKQEALPWYCYDEENGEGTAVLCQVRAQPKSQSHSARLTHKGMNCLPSKSQQKDGCMLASLQEQSCEPFMKSSSRIMAKKTLSNAKNPPSMPRSSQDSFPKLSCKNLVDKKKRPLQSRSRQVSGTAQDQDKPSLVGKPVKKRDGKMEKICSQIEAYFADDMAEDQNPECGSARSGQNKSAKDRANKNAQRDKNEQQSKRTVSVKYAAKASSSKRVQITEGEEDDDQYHLGVRPGPSNMKARSRVSCRTDDDEKEDGDHAGVSEKNMGARKRVSLRKQKFNPKDEFDLNSEESSDDGKTLGGPTFYMPKRGKKGKRE